MFADISKTAKNNVKEIKKKINTEKVNKYCEITIVYQLQQSILSFPI